MNPSLGKDGRPVLDEATFQKLLEAAYVVQEHSHGDNPSSPAEAKSEAAATGSDSTTTLAEIVETQHQIESGGRPYSQDYRCAGRCDRYSRSGKARLPRGQRNPGEPGGHGAKSG